jgi:glutamate synthase (NADPH/NADH) large chain
MLVINYHIALKYKHEGLSPDTIQLYFRGTVGLSFGAFNHNGLSITLTGNANDYVGKGMFGGRIVIGNTGLYGATGGELYAAGKAGERFAVKNSGAVAVSEGAAHHLCEYMTGGVVVALGKVGYNAGAGMTGGTIYFFNRHRTSRNMLNDSCVSSLDVHEEKDIQSLKVLIQNQYNYTESPLAGEILYNLDEAIRHFFKVIPRFEV